MALSSIDPPRNFTITTDERIRALTIGPPAWSVRKRKIEDIEAEWIEALVDLSDALLAEGRTEAEIDRALETKASTFDFERQNALVLLHNRWYPVEANLRMDPRTGEYLVNGRPWRPESDYDASRVLGCARARIAARDDGR